jgi:hypothetical protein
MSARAVGEIRRPSDVFKTPFIPYGGNSKHEARNPKQKGVHRTYFKRLSPLSGEITNPKQ